MAPIAAKVRTTTSLALKLPTDHSTAQKIKNDLIQKAKTKKAYAKIREQELANAPKTNYDDVPETQDEGDGREATHNGLHPERQAMIDSGDSTRSQAPRQDSSEVGGVRRKEQNFERRLKPSRYTKEQQAAEQRRLFFEEKRKAREERDRDRQAMAKARRPDQNGKLRLGRQSHVLLSRVQRLVRDEKT